MVSLRVSIDSEREGGVIVDDIGHKSLVMSLCEVSGGLGKKPTMVLRIRRLEGLMLTYLTIALMK